MIKVKALPDTVLVHNFKKGDRFVRGILLINDDGKTTGIRPRWAQIYSVGENVKDVQPGEWILIEHGRWSRGACIGTDDGDMEVRVWKVDYPTSVVCVSKEEPTDDIIVDRSY